MPRGVQSKGHSSSHLENPRRSPRGAMTKCHRGSCHTGLGLGGWLPLSDGKEVHSLVAPRGNPAPGGRGRLGFCCGPTLMLLQMLGLKCSAGGSWEEPR